MLAGLLIVVAVPVLAGAAALLTRPRSALELVLSAALLAYAWLVAIALGLSALDAFDATWVAACSALAAAVGVTIVVRRDARTDARPWRGAATGVGRALADPRVAAAGVLASLSLGYALALALLTPAAEIDAIAYHLARAAFWVQEGAIGPVAGSQDVRIDDSPPGAEILVAVTMLASGGVRFAGLVQLLAGVVLVCAVAAVARRLGADRPQAWFAGLLVAPLPSVVMQLPTGLNDLAAATTLVVAVAFVLGDRRVDASLAGLGVALLALTKMTALVAAPALLALAVLARPRGLRTWRLASVVAGAAVGASWVLLRRADTADGAVGGVSTSYAGLGDPVAIVGRLSRMLTQLLELPGAVGTDALLFLVAAVVLAAAAAARTGDRRALLGAAALVAATPILVVAAEIAARGHRKLWFELDRPELAFLDLGRPVTFSAVTGAWAGAVGLVITVLGVVVALRRRTWRSTPALGIVALAPVIWIVGFAIVLGYTSDEGRYVLPGVVLGAAATAPLLHRPLVAWWAVAVSATSLLLVWTHWVERPLGIRLVAGGAPASVWTRDDAVALGPVRALPEAIALVRREVPGNAVLAIWPAPFPDPPTPEPVALLPFPFFGDDLGRRVVLARTLDEAVARGAEWALLPGHLTLGCRAGWRRVSAPGAAYALFRREDGVRCAAARAGG